MLKAYTVNTRVWFNHMLNLSNYLYTYAIIMYLLPKSYLSLRD